MDSNNSLEILSRYYPGDEMSTQATEKTVADLTVAELRDVIRETVAEALAELIEDPDEGLELREEFVEEMAERLQSDEVTVPAEEVYERLGLD